MIPGKVPPISLESRISRVTLSAGYFTIETRLWAIKGEFLKLHIVQRRLFDHRRFEHLAFGAEDGFILVRGSNDKNGPSLADHFLHRNSHCRVTAIEARCPVDIAQHFFLIRNSRRSARFLINAHNNPSGISEYARAFSQSIFSDPTQYSFSV